MNQWMKWMLQLLTFINSQAQQPRHRWPALTAAQNGSILDGLLLWKSNIDKYFEGVEECAICYSIIHGTNCQLPKQVRSHVQHAIAEGRRSSAAPASTASTRRACSSGSAPATSQPARSAAISSNRACCVPCADQWMALKRGGGSEAELVVIRRVLQVALAGVDGLRGAQRSCILRNLTARLRGASAVPS